MRQHPENGWFPSSEFARAADVIHRVANTEHTRWLNMIKIKYIQLRIDQRTGDFIILDREGKILPTEELYVLFPELKD